MTRFALLLVSTALITACGTSMDTQYQRVALSDSLRADSIRHVQSAMLDEVMSSTQFVNDLNTEMGKLKVAPTLAVTSKLSAESAVSDMKAERAAVTKRMVELVARFDSSQARMVALRAQAKSLTDRDSALEGQVARSEAALATLRQTFEQERTQLQATIDQQGKAIATLTARVDTMTKVNGQLATRGAALADTVTQLTGKTNQLTTEKNQAFYVIGTKDDLLKRGILVEEGSRRFLIAGSRPLQPARNLDSASFTPIDRLHDRVITLPAGEYKIISRQNVQYTTPAPSKDGLVAGTLTIDQPEKFWQESKFLVLMKN